MYVYKIYLTSVKKPKDLQSLVFIILITHTDTPSTHTFFYTF